jgi:hypothetical protein
VEAAGSAFKAVSIAAFISASLGFFLQALKLMRVAKAAIIISEVDNFFIYYCV